MGNRWRGRTLNHSQISFENSIAQQAELEIWRGIRENTRLRLTRSISVGVLYLLAALAVGAYLLLAVAEVGHETMYMDGWEDEEMNLLWIVDLAWGYGGLALIAIIGYVFTLMLIRDKLPATVCRIVGTLPWIGPTMHIVAMGEFCQSIYQSVLRSQTYADALCQASRVVRNADLRQWSKDSSKRLESGHSLVSVLGSSPIQDHPLSAVTAFVSRDLSVNESVRIWHQATAECHLLAQSRLDRTIQFISVSSLLVSVLIASLALLFSGMLLRIVLDGWWIFQGWWMF